MSTILAAASQAYIDALLDILFEYHTCGCGNFWKCERTPEGKPCGHIQQSWSCNHRCGKCGNGQSSGWWRSARFTEWAAHLPPEDLAERKRVFRSVIDQRISTLRPATEGAPS